MFWVILSLYTRYLDALSHCVCNQKLLYNWNSELFLILSQCLLLLQCFQLFCFLLRLCYCMDTIQSQFKYSCVLGESNQLLNRTEHTMIKGAIARPAFKGCFVCIVEVWAVLNIIPVIPPRQFTHSWSIGESTQLCIIT